jgi:hypothetical protein
MHENLMIENGVRYPVVQYTSTVVNIAREVKKLIFHCEGDFAQILYEYYTDSKLTSSLSDLRTNCKLISVHQLLCCD